MHSWNAAKSAQVMLGTGGFIELQGTAEGAPFSDAELAAMLDLARGGLAELLALQRRALAASGP